MNKIISSPKIKSEFQPLFVGSGSTIVVGGGTTEIFRVTPPAGQRVRLTNLSTDPGTYRRLCSLFFGTTELINNDVISGDKPDDTNAFGEGYSVGRYQDYPAGDPPFNSREELTGKIDEAVYVQCGDSVSSVRVYYGYEFGE